jgi:hypothetical protein
MDLLLKSILPADIYQHFELVSVREETEKVEMIFEEAAELLPAALENKHPVVLDGFCNPPELLHFSIKGKPLYLKLYRRRWKTSGSNDHYSNRYDLHPEGVKATHEFASFLKGEIGLTTDEYVRYLVNTKS